MPITLPGSCFCRALTYELTLDSVDQARATLCHCTNCKKAFGTNYGLTAKVPVKSFKYTRGTPRDHRADNGVTREFCEICGSYILEYGDAAKNDFRYITVGSLDDPSQLPPKGEFFCKDRLSWMPQIPNTFQKSEIKE
ncbi:hypothetical protein I316_07377 [Kwoniella heveanensis BCC8398]|uniref:CENP-V/GFA domain-containing protein n=1 Tax=Kwoniella heveanensis BCC8398 TaxID=1296120 RepID=A0A1B9GIQ7_9TREE|nr:hypothetical protein I316_07377 [Kwoniella heveanensis BCC8398]